MQRYLIDTQILIWALISPMKITERVLRVLSSGSIFVSQTSLFEIAIKQSIGKLPELPISIRELEDVLRRDGFQLIPIANVHIDAYNVIPLYDQHRDPFDRLILATAYSEKMQLVSADENFGLYKNLISIVEM
jgi:PIN domain nuclease of toxin-antitoxin system